jgi:hypothetical protein
MEHVQNAKVVVCILLTSCHFNNLIGGLCLMERVTRCVVSLVFVASGVVGFHTGFGRLIQLCAITLGITARCQDQMVKGAIYKI